MANSKNYKGGYQDDDAASQYSEMSAYDRTGSSEICRRIHLLFMQQLYTDVKFVINCGMKPKPTLHAHKAILAIGSDKFREMLIDDNNDKGPLKFQINDINYDAFRNVVEYLYTNEAYFEDEISALDTFSAASKFQIQSLMYRCESYLESSELTENNVCLKFQLATNYKLTLLKNRCVEFIQENTAAVMRSPAFITVSMSTVRSICKLEKLNLRSEMELLEGVLRWTDAQPDAKKNKRTLIEPFLRHIRFLTLSCNEFNRFVQDNPTIFTAPEAANILTSLVNPKQPSNLPSWCNKGAKRCTIYQVPFKPRRNISSPDQYFSIPLKPSQGHQSLTNLKCVLQVNSTRGNHAIKAVRLSFDDPVHESSTISHLVINVLAESSKFSLEEHVNITNLKSVVVRFSKAVSINAGQTVYITVEAKDVRNYKFLQFDNSKSFEQDSPFKCIFTSERKFASYYLISQLIYRKSSGRFTNKQHYRK